MEHLELEWEEPAPQEVPAMPTTVKMRAAEPISSPPPPRFYDQHESHGSSFVMSIDRDGWLRVTEFVDEQRSRVVVYPPDVAKWLFEGLSRARDAQSS